MPAEDRAGGMLWRAAERYELTQQMRAAACEVQAARVAQLRSTEGGVTEELVASLKVLSRDDIRTGKWHNPLLLTGTNSVRMQYNAGALARFADARGVPIIAWRVAFPTDVAINVGARLEAQIFEKFDVETTEHFVMGAPCMVLAQIHQRFGVCNGTSAHYLDLVLPEATRQRDTARILAAKPGETVMLEAAPAHLVLEIEANEALAEAIRSGDLPTIATPSADGRAAFPFARSGGRGPELDIGKRKIKTLAFPVTPALALTFHKVQGLTCENDRGLLDLSKPKKGSLALTYEMLLVAVSRFRAADDYRVLPLPPGEDLRWLNRTRTPSSTLTRRIGGPIERGALTTPSRRRLARKESGCRRRSVADRSPHPRTPRFQG